MSLGWLLPLDSVGMQVLSYSDLVVAIRLKGGVVCGLSTVRGSDSLQSRACLDSPTNGLSPHDAVVENNII